MKKFLLLFLLSSTTAFAQNVMNTYATDAWNGYVNVFSSDTTYEFGFQEAVLEDVKTEFDDPNELITLHPNFKLYAENETDPEWVDQTTGEGLKIIEGNTFVESNTAFNGQDLTFTGEVKEYTISPDYDVKYFIKALDENNDYQDALNQSKVFDLPESGAFSVSATAEELADGLIIQYGFAVLGRNANIDSLNVLGNVVVGTLDCDSYVVDSTTSTSEITIEANKENASYQWLDCNDGYALIDGETNQSFTAPEIGNYAVEVTEGICVDTSECTQITAESCNLDSTTTTTGITIEANAENASYQWVDCDNSNIHIDGETNQSFTPSENGNYAVEITQGFCFATSDCIEINTVNLNEFSSEKELSIFPNPAQSILNIANTGSFKSFKIVDNQGKLILSNVISKSIDINSLETGHYFIYFFDGDKRLVKKLIKK